MSWEPDGGPYPTVLAWLGERTLTPALILSAHLDTSPPAPESTRDAYAAERSGGRIWGRGATFAKSDVAVYLNAAVAARDLGAGASALVSITADEGQGGAAGPGHLLDDARNQAGAGNHAGDHPRGGICHQRGVCSCTSR